MRTNRLKPGDVVQIDPDHDPVFGGAFMVVTEVKSWGAQGYVPMGVYMGGARPDITNPSPAGVQAFYRCPNAAMELIGRAVWATDDSEEAARRTND